MNEIITAEYFEGQGCTCYATSANECGCEGADWTPTEVYKLRDDAKQLADRLTALELHSTSELARLEHERNEAKNKMADALQEVDLRTLDLERMKDKYATEATEHMLAVNKLCGERDEAREALMKIEDLFIDGTDIYADRENMGMIAREALEGAK